MFLTVPVFYFVSVSQICPALDHAALVHVNSMLETIPVKTEVDHYIGIDYSLIDDPVVTSRSLDMHFRVRHKHMMDHMVLLWMSCSDVI